MKKITENTKVTLTLGQLKKLVKESVIGDFNYLVVCGKSQNDHPTMMWVAQFNDRDDADALAEHLNKDVYRSRCEGATMKFWVEAAEDGQLVGEADEDDFEDEPVLDRDGEEIHVGDWVEFTDPETEDSLMYQVSKINGEIVVLDKEDGECEAFGEECKVRKPSKEMTPGRYEPMRGFNTKQWWVYDNDDDCFIDPPKEVLDLLDKEETEEGEEALLQEIVDKNPDWLYDMAFRFYGDIEI